jgi:four helix bundle protein
VENYHTETQSWLQFAVSCGYVKRDVAASLYREYDQVLAVLVKMINRPEDWSV